MAEFALDFGAHGGEPALGWAQFTTLRSVT